MRFEAGAVVFVSVLCASSAFADTRAEARRYFARGMARIEQGAHAEGIADLKRAYEIRPHRNVLFNIGRAYASIGDLTRAIEYFEQYLDTNPPDANRARSNLRALRERQRLRALVDEGMAAISAGRHLEGVALLQRAHKVRPHPNILFNIGRAHEDAGQLARAVAAYRRYLEDDPPDAVSVRTRVALLERRAAARASAAAPVKRPARPGRRQIPGTRGTPRASADASSRPRDRTPEPPASTRGESELSGASPDRVEEQLQQMAQQIIDRMREERAGREASTPRESEGPRGLSSASAQRVRRTSPAGSAARPLDPAAAFGSDVVIEAKDGQQYEEVVVSASRQEQSPLDAPNAVTVLTDEDIRLSGARSLPELFRRVPGMDVMAMSYSEYNVAMRGLNRRVANKILVLIDGRTAYQDFFGATIWKDLPLVLEDIAQIEIVRGPGSAIYGAYAYTGIINIVLKRPDEIRGALAQVAAGNGERVEAVFQYGSTEGPFGFRISGGYDRGDKYALEFDPDRVDYQGAADDPELSLEAARVLGELEYNMPDSSSRLFVGGSVSSSKYELFGVATLRNVATETDETRVHAGYTSDVFQLRAFWNYVDGRGTPQFFPTGLRSLSTQLHSHLMSIESVYRPEFKLFGQHQLVLGAEYRFKFIDWNYLNDEQSENHFAGFFQDTWRVTETLSVILSGRLDLHPLIGPLGSPRVAAIYKPTPNQAIRLTVGTAFRQPTMAETYLNLTGNSPVAGALARLVGGFEDLDPESILTVDVGYRIQPEWGELEVVGYFNRISNLIVRTPLLPTGPDEPLDPELEGYLIGNSFYVNDTDRLLAFGSELSARVYPVDGLDFGASYSFQYIYREDSGERYTDSPVHKISAWGYLRTRLGLDFGMSGHFVSAQEWIEPEYDLEDPTGFDTTPLPLDASFVLTGRVGYRLLDGRLELSVAGTNLTDWASNRHREHPFGNRLEARVIGMVTGRL